MENVGHRFIIVDLQRIFPAFQIQFAERRYNLICHINSSRFSAFGSACSTAVVGPLNQNVNFTPVDVGPFQRKDFSDAKAGPEGHQKKGVPLRATFLTLFEDRQFVDSLIEVFSVKL